MNKMDAVVQWAENVCFAAIGSAVLGFLLPKGSAAKTARAVLGLFMVWMIFLPVIQLSQTKIQENAGTSWTFESQNNISGAAAEYAGGRVAAQTETLLRENGISFEQVQADCNIEENGVINIYGIRIVTDEDPGTVRELIRQEWQLEPEIVPAEREGENDE